MSDIRSRLLRRFRDHEYRHAYVDSFLNSLVSTQIRELRERKGWSQAHLAEAIGTVQSGVSRVENPDYFSWRIETLRKIARAFDMALSVKFVSFGDELEDITRFGEDRLMRPSFEDDTVFPRENGSEFGQGNKGKLISFPSEKVDVLGLNGVKDPEIRAETTAANGEDYKNAWPITSGLSSVADQ